MTADTVGGVWSYANDLRAALDHDVVLVTMSGEAREGADHHADFRLEWMDDPWDDVAAAGEWLLELEERERPDVVHLNGYAHGALPWRAPCVVVAHSDVISWWRTVRGEDAPPEWDRYRSEVAAGLRGADAVVAITGAVADDVEEQYGVRAGVIHNGSPAPVTTPRKEQLIVGSGRLWDEAKNLRALDAAAEDLPWPVVVPGPLNGATASFATTPGRLPREEFAALRRRAAIYCAPARYEPFGLAILEAARDRCALVLSDIPSLREIWGDAVLYVDPADPRPALLRLIEDDAERDRLAEAAQERSLRYDMATMAREYSSLYERVAAAGAAA